MGIESDDTTSLRFSPRLARLLAFGWAAAMATVFLFKYDGWLVFVQLAHLFAGAVPTLSIGPHFPEFVRAVVVSVLCVIAIFGAAFAVGATVIDRWTPEKNLLAALFSLAVGLWVVAVATLIVGAMSVRQVQWVFVLLGFWMLPGPRKFLRRREPLARRFSSWPKLMFAFIVVAAILNLAGAVVPPFEYDELEYHLGSLADYTRVGHIVFLPHNFYSNMPQLTEMLYLLAMTTTSDIAAKLLHWSFGVLSTLAIFAIGTRLWSRNVGMTAAALFYCVPFVQDLSSTARIDLATTFFATLAFGGLLTESTSLTAMMAGCAVATKWTAMPVVLLPVLIVGFKSVRRTSVFCLLSSVVVLPWLLKNWLLTGNPVYPLIYGGPHWTTAQAELFAQKHYPHFNLREVWELPWRYSFTESGAVPLLFLTAPLMFLRRANHSTRRVAWLFAAAYAGWYLTTFHPWRFLFPAFPLAAMLGAYALETTDKWVRGIISAMLAVALAALGLNPLVDVEDPKRVTPQVSFLTYALGQQPRDEFVARIGRGMFEPLVWMNRSLPASATVLFIGEARAYYAKQHVLWSTAFDQHPLEKMDIANLHASGVTHVYVNVSEWERLRTHYNYLLDIDDTALRNQLQQHARLIHSHGRSTVWKLD